MIPLRCVPFTLYDVRLFGHLTSGAAAVAPASAAHWLAHSRAA